MEGNKDTAVLPHSPLPHLGLVLATPSPALAPYVHSYWFIDRSWKRPYPLEEFLYPEGGLGVIFNFGEPLVVNGTAVTDTSFLDATNSTSTRLGFPQNVTAVGIRFRPGGAYPFLPVPLKELLNQPLALDDIFTPTLSSIGQKLAALPSFSQKISHLEWMLWHWHASHRAVAPVIQTSLAAVYRSQGQIGIRSLADANFISQRQLERLFQAQVGMSAKTYARLVRIQAARTALRQEAASPAAQVSQEFGFHDQSHFIRDFQAVMGQTPLQYRQARAERRQKLLLEKPQLEVKR